MHVIVPRSWTVQAGHDLDDQLQLVIATALDRVPGPTHFKPTGEDKCFHGQGFRREDGGW